MKFHKRKFYRSIGSKIHGARKDKDSQLGHEIFMLHTLIGSTKIETPEEFDDRVTAYAQHKVDLVDEIARQEEQIKTLEGQMRHAKLVIVEKGMKLKQAQERIKLYDEAYAIIIASSQTSMMLKAIDELAKALLDMEQDLDGGLPWLKFNSLKIMGDLTMENQGQKERIAELEGVIADSAGIMAFNQMKAELGDKWTIKS